MAALDKRAAAEPDFIMVFSLGAFIEENCLIIGGRCWNNEWMLCRV